MATSTSSLPSNFVADIIEKEISEGKHSRGNIVTRFPPEPNGYLHLGHAKSICLNFGLARQFGGRCHLRFDDTNPTKEETEYVESIMNDVKWLGGDWGEHLHYASDYFDTYFDWALHLIKTGFAYVDDQTLVQIRENRGSLFKPGVDSPFRERSVEENLALFLKMKEGAFPEGHCVLRAKIDMSHPNLNMRDPIVYRIQHAEHHRTGNKWCIYPMYDYAHGQGDSIEGITHSVCTLEFELHRPLYEWFLEHLPVPCKPRQIEFARLNLTYTLMSKRKLLELVQQKIVRGWDDPRMPTISGMRRRGFSSQGIRNFCERIGVTKRDSTVDLELLLHCIEEDIQDKCARRLAVLNPLKVRIVNKDESDITLEVPNHPDNAALGSRQVLFSSEIYIERDDFMEKPDNKFFRLAPGKEVRLRYACLITCTDVVKDGEGKVVEVLATWDPTSVGGNATDGRKVKGTIHWVSAKHGINAEARIYDTLFSKPEPESLDDVNPNSLKVVEAVVEPSLAKSAVGECFQFERKGYYTVDPDSTADRLVFNRTLGLRDTYAKETKEPEKKKEAKPAKEAAEAEPEGTPFSCCLFKVGRIVECKPLEGSEKLYLEKIDLGEEEPRTIVSGLRHHIPLEQMQNRMVVVIANLEKKKLAGVVSEGMVMCANGTVDGVEKVEIIDPPAGARVGERIHCAGHDGKPLEVIKAKNIKRIFQPVLDGLNTSDDCVARYENLPWETSAGVCRCLTIKGGKIA